MKYKNIPTIVDGIRFDSKGEAARWQELKWLEKAGEISNLRRQVKYDLTAHGVKICRIIPDFEYEVDGVTVTEDFKGLVTATFKIKAKLFAAQEGRPILVSKSKR